MREAVVGFSVSTVLLFLAMWIGAGGDGVISPAWLLCAPIPAVIGEAAFWSAPLFWALVGGLTTVRPKWLFPIFILLHYAVGLSEIIPIFKEDVWEFSDLMGPVGLWLAFWTLLYLGGQVALWTCYLRAFRPANKRRLLSA